MMGKKKQVIKKRGGGMAKKKMVMKKRGGGMMKLASGGSAKKEFTIRAGKKVLDATKGTPMENQAKKNVKKSYKKAGIGKPKGYAKTGPSMSAKKKK